MNQELTSVMAFVALQATYLLFWAWVASVGWPRRGERVSRTRVALFGLAVIWGYVVWVPLTAEKFLL